MTTMHYHLEFSPLKVEPKHRLCPRCEEVPPAHVCDCGEELCGRCAAWTVDSEHERRVTEEQERRERARDGAVDAAIDDWKERRGERDK